MSRALSREETTYSGKLQKEMTSWETFCRGEDILWTFSQPGDSMVITRYDRNSTLQVFYRREIVYWRCIMSCCGAFCKQKNHMFKTCCCTKGRVKDISHVRKNMLKVLRSINQSIYFVTHNRIYKTKVTKTFTLCVTSSTQGA